MRPKERKPATVESDPASGRNRQTGDIYHNEIHYMAMRRLLLFFVFILAIVTIVGCKNNKTQEKVTDTDSILTEDSEADSTAYGICGEGTAMHTLELVTDAGDTLSYMIADGEADMDPVVLGGLLVGDRMAVTACNVDGELIATKIINLTTLLGKWTSIDKNFDIEEGGVVRSNVKAETRPWTSWKILNGNLLLNKDTFMIDGLGADSLYLENKTGIFAFKRVK